MAMSTKKHLLVLTLGLAMAATSSAVLYKVGDTNGWTILGSPNYSDWAGKKTFHVGDTIGKFCSTPFPLLFFWYSSEFQRFRHSCWRLADD
jgi:hypothetical protein